MADKSREQSFRSFFAEATSGFQPYQWQLQVALEGLPDILPIPTGLGKTEVALAWAWRGFVIHEPEPLHLVYCLPIDWMRRERFAEATAALFKLAEKTVYAMTQAGEIPAFKIRGQWCIKRTERDQWFDAQPRGGDGGGRGE